MAKKIRFPLKMAEGKEVRSLDEFRENFDLEAVLEYYNKGKLLTWLEDRYLEGEAEAIRALDETGPDFHRQLCAVFQVKYTGNDVDVEEIECRQERLKRLRTITNETEYIQNIDSVAFDQEELADLLDEGAEVIYLCLFGLIDPDHAYNGKQKAKILHVLATASETRGTDATGYALNTGDKLYVYKRPVPGHKLQFRLRDDTTVVMGHTRMTTQGDEAKNENNHPFLGSIAGRPFALAHNGVLWNDKDLRQELNVPKTKIETDSYIAVQLLESQASLDFASLKYIAEQVRGTFTFTVLTDTNELYFIRGDNPLYGEYAL